MRFTEVSCRLSTSGKVGGSVGVLVFNRGGTSPHSGIQRCPTENLLTDTRIKSVKPTNRELKLSDGGGLFLLVKPTGGKLWRWKYRLQGKENLFAIGTHPRSEPC